MRLDTRRSYLTIFGVGVILQNVMVRVWLYLQKSQCLYLQKFVQGEKKLIVPCISTCYTPKKQIIREEEKINGQILAYSCRCPFEIFPPKITPILKLEVGFFSN